MTNEQMLRLVERQLQAYNARNIEAFCACFHPEVQAKMVDSDTVRLKGMDAFKKNYGELFSSSPKLHCELKSRIVLGETVLDEEWVTGSINYPNGLHAVAIYGFRDGLIDRIWFVR